MRSGLHNIAEGFISGKTASLQQVESGFVRAAHESAAAGGNDSNTVLLLHCDGTDASTTFTDASVGGGHGNASVDGNAQVDTAQSKFGGASLLLDGSGDDLNYAYDADWDLGAVGGGNDFTLDMWIRFASGATISQTRFLSTGGGWEWYMSSGTAIALWTAPGPTQTAWSWTPSTETWYHLALVRTGTTFKMFIDGTNLGDGTERDMGAASTALYVGRYSGSGIGYFNGHMDEIRISKGIARWTANFTPPTAAYS